MRVLAVTHEASRTGSVNAFLESLQVMRSLATEVVVVVKTAGPLVVAMERLATQVLVTPRSRTYSLRRLARLPALRAVAPHVERHVADRVVRTVAPDLVYANTVLSSEYCAAAQRAGIPTLLHVHEQQPLAGWGLRRGGASLPVLRSVTPSDYVADELRQLGMPPARVLRGPFRLPTEPAESLPAGSWSPGVLRVVGCGSVEDWKGVQEWLVTAGRVARVGDRAVEWTWIGGGSLLSSLRSRTEAQGLADRVRWVGQIDDPRPWLASADLLVHPSRRDAGPLVVLEAAAEGTPTVAFAVGGVPQLVTDPRALAAPGDVDELVHKVRCALTEPALRRELLSHLTRTLLDCAAEKWGADLADALTEAMAG